MEPQKLQIVVWKLAFILFSGGYSTKQNTSTNQNEKKTTTTALSYRVRCVSECVYIENAKLLKFIENEPTN